ncbi:MAG: hypothetical protein A4S12_06660 [Proteobacteria bacterium SG_bin5]|nr:hypothetical protein [Sphingomonas sp.]OQW42666.1 MAG: hypothetical protein A4S12_06660 [Proteobacteria bacterium SG_bin5]
MSGYSPRPLAEKLGLKPGMRAWFCHMPEEIRAELAHELALLDVQTAPSAGLEAAHLFVTERATLERQLPRLRDCLAPAGFLWVSWPKKASGVAGDVSEDVVRAVALPLDLVDVKVCAVDEIWSGLKLMIRREAR